jgi:hypothetical protein
MSMMTPQQQFHQRAHVSMHGPGVEYHHPHHPSLPSYPGVPEMAAEIQAGPGHPMTVDGLPLAYTNPNLDHYELQQLEQHRKQIQKLQQLEQNANAAAAAAAAAAAIKASSPHEVGMARSMSDHHHYGNPALRQFQTERQRQHSGSNLSLMIPSTSNGRLVVSAGPSPVSGSFPVSPVGYPGSPPSMLASQPHSPAMSIHSPTQTYHHPGHAHPAVHHHHPHHLHHRHSLQHLQSHGPSDATDSMARLLQQELVIKHDLEMYEQQGKQKQLELARISLQKYQLAQHHQKHHNHGVMNAAAVAAQEQQQTLERFKQMQQQLYQQHMAAKQDPQARLRYNRRPSLQFAPTAGLALSGPLPPVHDEEMVSIDG